MIAEVTDGPAAEARLREEGVWCVAIGPRQVRLVTHRDVGDADVERAAVAAGALGKAATARARAAPPRRP